MMGYYTLLHLLFFFFFSLLLSHRDAQGAPTTRFTDMFPSVSITNNAHVIFGQQNVKTGSFATISLTKTTGSGLASNSKYEYGFFSTAMKLPSGYSSGVVVAFYLSNSDVFPNNHDEIDFELLGHQQRREWILQTNIYGNGSVKTGREEKFRLWFDPTHQFHEYTILWNSHHVVFLVDNIPIREVVNTKAMSAYPSKPMTVYATIWDASDWATSGGKYPVDYNYSPFVASLGKLKMSGCLYNTSQTCVKKGSLDPVDGNSFIKLSPEQTQGLEWARSRYMVYSYCKDTARYKVLPAECNGI